MCSVCGNVLSGRVVYLAVTSDIALAGVNLRASFSCLCLAPLLQAAHAMADAAAGQHSLVAVHRDGMGGDLCLASAQQAVLSQRSGPAEPATTSLSASGLSMH